MRWIEERLVFSGCNTFKIQELDLFGCRVKFRYFSVILLVTLPELFDRVELNRIAVQIKRQAPIWCPNLTLISKKNIQEVADRFLVSADLVRMRINRTGIQRQLHHSGNRHH